MQKSHHSAGVMTYPEHSFGTICLTSLLLAGMSFGMGAKGPLIAACLASLLLVVRSIGFHAMPSTRRFVPMVAASVTLLGPFAVHHSHYHKKEDRRRHEFAFRGKYLCAGCYGIAVGTLLGLTLALTYFFIEMWDSFYKVLAVVAPLCLVPAMVQCFGWRPSSAVQRFISYGLLPIGSWIILVLSDRWFHNTLVNLAVLGLIVVAWRAGGTYKKRQPCPSVIERTFPKHKSK